MKQNSLFRKKTVQDILASTQQGQSDGHESLGKHLKVRDLAAFGIAAIPFLGLLYGSIKGKYDYRVHRVRLKFKDLPDAFDGFRITQLSDIHCGSLDDSDAVKRGIELANMQESDLVVFTGDFVNNRADELDDWLDHFGSLNARFGKFSVLGNHDYGDYVPWSSPRAKAQNLADLKEAHRLMGWNLLLDTHHPLTIENESIGILGIQNWGAGGFAKYGNLEKTLENTQDLPVKLLLSHDPSHWREQVLGKTNIDASFAGHTHGMQFGVKLNDFKWSPVQYIYKEWAGLYHEQNQQLYVNVGYGFLGYPGRVGILPEITIFTLSKA